LVLLVVRRYMIAYNNTAHLQRCQR